MKLIPILIASIILWVIIFHTPPIVKYVIAGLMLLAIFSTGLYLFVITNKKEDDVW